MIPKIIHLCWLSGDPFPKDIARCLESWEEHLKDYTIWLWGKLPADPGPLGNMNVEVKEFDLNSTLWTKQAFEARKYAFAADYIRLYALYTYGGIYLDADILVYKSFDELLALPYFIGHDQIRAFEAAVIGCEPGCTWIGDILKHYDRREFVKEDGELDTIPLPDVFRRVLVQKGYRFQRINAFVPYHDEEKFMTVFDGDFFNSRDALEVRRTKKSFCAHNYAGSWKKNTTTRKEQFKRFLPKWLLKSIYVIGQCTWNINKFVDSQIPFTKKPAK